MERFIRLFTEFFNATKALIFKYPVPAAGIFLFYFVYIFIIFYDKKVKDKHVRGVKIIKPKKFSFKKKSNENENIFIGDVELPVEEENKQMFLFGRPGSGKTTVYNNIIEKLIQRNDKAIIYDEKFDYIPLFYNPEKDLILNIADSRTLKWSIINEIKDKADLVSVAKSLIPDAVGTEQHWNDTARAIFTAMTREFLLSGKTKNKQLFSALSQKTEDILVFLQEQNAPEAVHISNPRNASDVMSTLMRYISWLEYAEDGDFTIQSWLNDPSKRFIFVANNPKIKDIQKPLLALFIDLISKNVLFLPEDRNRRFYFLLDELGTLGRLNSVVDLLTQGRSKGIRTFAGVQDIGQFDKLYGQETRNTLINACSIYVLLAQNEFSNAKFASDLVSSPEVWTSSHSSNDAGADSSSQQSQQIKPLILPSEFQSMDNLTAYVRILKNWQFTGLKPYDKEPQAPGFILNNSFAFTLKNEESKEEGE